MLPNLYRRLDNNKIPQDVLAKSWTAMRDAFASIAPECLGYLPMTYELAMRQQRGSQGRLHPTTFDIPPEMQAELADRYLQNALDLSTDFRGAYFVHELRGTKAFTAHDLDDPDFRRERLSDYLDNYRPEALDDRTSQWDIDIAIEVSVPGHVVHILESAHAKLLRWLLPSLDERRNTMLRKNDKFYVDHAASLRDLAGFRCETHRHGERDSVSYINVYSTEKAQHYQLHEGGLYRHQTPRDVLPNHIDTLINDLEKVSALYSAAAGIGDEAGAPASARVEIRVPVEKALVKLSSIPADVLQDCFIAIPLKNWW